MDSRTKYNPRDERERAALDMEEDEELFEINLEAVDNIPPPCYYWDGYLTPTSDALLANCLLPATDLSSAVPVVSSKSQAIYDREHQVVSVTLTGLPKRGNLLAEMQMLWGVAKHSPCSARLLRIPSID